MKANVFILLFIFIFFSSPLSKAQQEVTGRITDASNGKPMSFASIHISNTTIKTISDESGNYSLIVQGWGSFEIVVSYLGYNPVFHKVDLPDSFHHIDFALRVSEIMMKEVTINAAGSKHKQKDIDLFWRTLLGEKPSKNGLEVLNPEKMYYYLNNDNILTASCHEPIEIVNHQMGYRIQFILQNFKHNYSNNETEYYGAPFFEELIPQNNRENSRWERKRKEVYSISFTRFLRALYSQKIHKEGFLLVYGDSIKNKKSLPVNLNEILQVEQEIVRVNVNTPLVLMCIAKPVTDQIIENSYREIWMKDEFSPIIVLRPQQIIINSDGTYAGLLETQEIQKSIFGLSAKLPIEYIDE